MSETIDQGDAPTAEAGLNDDLVITFAPIAAPGGGEVTSITIIEPTAAQIAQWDNLTGTASQIKAISICGTVPEAVVRQLKARPFMQAVRRIESFLA